MTMNKFPVWVNRVLVYGSMILAVAAITQDENGILYGVTVASLIFFTVEGS